MKVNELDLSDLCLWEMQPPNEKVVIFTVSSDENCANSVLDFCEYCVGVINKMAKGLSKEVLSFVYMLQETPFNAVQKRVGLKKLFNKSDNDFLVNPIIIKESETISIMLSVIEPQVDDIKKCIKENLSFTVVLSGKADILMALSNYNGRDKFAEIKDSLLLSGAMLLSVVDLMDEGRFLLAYYSEQFDFIEKIKNI